MTLTYSALARADEILWLVTGADKRQALTQLLKDDRTIPAGRVEAERSIIMTDLAAL
jgi:6-phosphogluconolactonase/glucosamine-6-phosphate isomerase/deaminase